MNFNPLERRRVEAFARQLDSDGTAHPHLSPSARASGTAIEDELAELLEVTERLHGLGEQAMAASRPSDHWRDATRRRLMAVAEEEGIGATARHSASARVPKTERAPVLDDLFRERPHRGRRFAIIAALLTGTVAVSGVSAASGDALPGETLYNVKRTTEKAQLALAGNDLSRAQLHLEFARTRIEEAAAVSGEDEAVQHALEDAATELLAGASLLGELAVESGDTGPLDYIDLFTNEQHDPLVELVGGLGENGQTAGDELIALVEEAAVRSIELRQNLECTAPGGRTDKLGPVPGECGSEGGDEPSDPGQTPSGAAETGQTESPRGEADDDGEPSEPAEDQSGLPEGPEDTPGSEGTADAATDGETSSDEDAEEPNGSVLDELSGIISDLID